MMIRYLLDFGLRVLVALHFFWNLSVTASQCQGNLSSVEYQVLQTIYNTTNGAWWNLTECGVPPYPGVDYGNPWVFPSSLSSPCTDGWVGVNCSRSDVIDGCYVVGLNLSNCNVSGALPDAVEALHGLQILDIRQNMFSRSLPYQLGQLTSLLYLDASYNDFSSSIPWQLGNLSSIEYLNLYTNDFTGPIPESLSNLTDLQYLGLGDSFATGTIPESYCKLTKAIYFSISYSMITGTIPTALAALSVARYLLIAENLLTGSVPVIENMTSVISLVLNSNYLTVLPEIFPPNLEIVFLYNNHFHGTLPPSVYQPHLNELLIYGNKLTGTLPSSIGTSTNLASMNVMKNRFIGHIPTEFGLLKSIVFCVFSTNYFSGPIPTQLSGLTSLEVLQISNTFITGTIPTEFGSIPNLFELYLTNSYLTGTIPVEIGFCSVLNTLELAQNFLTGTIPADAIRNVTTLQSLNFTRNSLIGNINDLFYVDDVDDHAVFANLVSIDMSYNSFTGSVPKAMFALPSLQTVSLLLNCLHGTIPEQICGSRGLQVLVMDSISGANACELYIPPIFATIIEGTFSNGFVGGTIPSCIFSMPNLTTLHLSGNGLTGSIADIPETSNLIDVALNSNYLTGSIPKSIQHYGKFIQLGLSNNKFHGILSHNFSVNPKSSKLDLTVNRLSGPVPSSFQDVLNIDVLNGNLFGCNILPKNDPDSSTYLCGSSALNISIFVWLITSVVALLVFEAMYLVHRRWRGEDSHPNSTNANPNTLTELQLQSTFLKATVSVDSAASSRSASSSLVESVGVTVGTTLSWWSANHVAKRSFATSMLLYILKAAAYVAWVLALLYLLVMLSAYALLKLETDSISTHTYQYAWLLTAAYMHGFAPTVLIVIVLILGSIVVTVFYFNVLSKLIQISDYFAAKTKMLVIESETLNKSRECSASVSGLVSPMHLMKPAEGESAVSSNITPQQIEIPKLLTCESLHAKPMHSPYNPEDSISASSVTNDSDIDVGRPSDTIYRRRSSIFNLFGSIASIKSQKSAQLRSHWVTGQTSKQRFLFFREVFLHVINAAMTISLNAGYVALLLSDKVNPMTLSTIQIVFGIYKVGWKAIVVPQLINGLLSDLSRSDQIFHQAFIDVFNFIASPVIATLLTDSACFLNVFQADMPVTTQYKVNANFYEICLSDVNSNSTSVSAQCHSYFSLASVTQSVIPPWVYSYQCSSAIFINYVPVLFYTFTFSGIVLPIAQYVLMFARDDTVQALLSESYRDAIITNKIYWPSFFKEGEQYQKGFIFNVGSLISTIILHFSVLMTFGMVSPILGFTVACGLTTMAMQWRLVVGRYLMTCPLSESLLFKKIEDATSGICSGIFGCLRILVMMVAIFWGVISFDMVADVYGSQLGIISTVCILFILPLPFCVVFYVPSLVSRFSLAPDWNFVTPTRWNLSSDIEEPGSSSGNGNGNGSDSGIGTRSRDRDALKSASVSEFNPSDYLRDSFFLPRWTDDF